MKKYLTGLVCALLLTGCQMDNNRARSNTNTNGDYNTQNDTRDGMDDFGNDVRDDLNDFGDDIRDGYDDVRDDMNGNHDSNQNGNTTDNTAAVKPDTEGPYTIYQPETSLWNVPSFCNSLVGRPYPASLL